MPAREAEIAVVADAFEVDRRTQAVFTGDVVAAQERAVAGIAAIDAQAPVLVELEAAIGFEIATELVGPTPDPASTFV
jgi:hypothetical protein